MSTSMSLWLGIIAAVACNRRPAEPSKSEPAAAVVATPPDRSESATRARAMAAYDAKQWDSCAEQFTSIAKTGDEPKRHDALYSAACCYAQGGRANLAFSAIDAAITAGLRNVDGVQEDAELLGLHGDSRWAKMIAAMKDANEAWERSLKAPELRRELLALVEEDQAARTAFADQQRRGVEPNWARVIAIDEKTTKIMRRVIATYGWPAQSLVGDDGAHAAWLLVQHADRDPALQKDVLERMRPMLKAGEVTRIAYAYLEDHVAVAEHRPQRYGTQFKDNGEPQPIEDEAHLDARRKEIGLGTMAEYKAALKKM
jgi:hypothetical protein